MGRKTRKHKIIADKRRNFFYEIKTISLQTPGEVKDASSPKTVVAQSSYLSYDLKKTAIVTAAILAAQLVLFFLLKNQLINLFGLLY